MTETMTRHAQARAQQRSIPPLILGWLMEFGTSSHDNHGAEVLYFDKQSRKALKRAVGTQVVERLSSMLDAYAVLSSEGLIITVGHRFKPVRSH